MIKHINTFKLIWLVKEISNHVQMYDTLWLIIKFVLNLTPGHIRRLHGLLAKTGVKVRLKVTIPRIWYNTLIRLKWSDLLKKFQIMIRYMTPYVWMLKSSLKLLPVIYGGFSAYWLRWEWRSDWQSHYVVYDKKR